MTSPQPSNDDAILNAFLRRYFADREAGTPGSAEDYAALWPKHRDTVIEVWRRLEEGSVVDVSPVPEPTSRTIGDYEILEEIGRGGQGQVFKARDSRLGRIVALKVLRGTGAVSPAAAERFWREATLAGRLRHPGICPVYDAGTADGIPYLAMPFLEGRTLAAILREATDQDPGATIAIDLCTRGGDTRQDEPDDAGSIPLSAPDRTAVLNAARLVEEVARALHVAHEAGVIHRDLKPSNILVRQDGRPVVLDFGLARAEVGVLPTLTATGDLLGTPSYMSPEQLLAGRVPIDRRTDVYSLGVTLFESLTRRRPFEAANREALFQAIQLQEPPDVRRLNRAVPRDLAVVVETALRKERDRRYQTALDFAEDLRRVRCSEPVAARRVGLAGRLLRWARRRPARAALAATLAVLIPGLTAAAGHVIATLPELERERQSLRAERVERLLAEGFLAYEADNAEAALDAFGRAQQIDFGNLEIDLATAWILARTYRISDARRVLDRLPEPDRQRVACNQIQQVILGHEVRAVEIASLKRDAGSPKDALDSFYMAMRARDGFMSRDDPRSKRRMFDLFAQAVHSAPEARLIYHLHWAEAAGMLADAPTCRRIAGILTRLWPKEPGAHFGASKALATVDPPAALAAAGRAIEIDPDGVVARMQRVTLLNSSGRLAEAESECQAILARSPDHAGTQMLLSRILRRIGRTEEAIAAGRSSVARAPRNPRMQQFLADALLAAGRAEEAMEAAHAALAVEPIHVNSLSALAIGLGMTGRAAEALVVLRRAVEISPMNALVRSNLARELQAQGMIGESIEHVRKAVELAPEHTVIRLNLGLALLAGGPVQEAAAVLCRAAAAGQDVPGGWVKLAEQISARGETEAALEVLQAVTGAFATDVGLRVAAGRLLLDRRRPAEAAAMFEAGLALDPEHPEARCFLGLALRDQGRLKESLAELRRGHAGAGTRGPRRHPPKDWIDEVERLTAAEEHLDPPPSTSPAESTKPAPQDLARVLHLKGRFREEAGIWRSLIGSQEEIPAQVRDQCALRFASSLVRAAGEESRSGTAASRESGIVLESEALAVLRKDLDARVAASGDDDRRAAALRRKLRTWLAEPDLSPTRNWRHLVSLPADDAQAWAVLWTRVRQIVGDEP